MSSEKQTLAIVVNGALALIERNVNAPLRSAIGKVLADTGNVGQPMENWELRDSAGNLLDLDRKIGMYNFPDDVRLFLNLKAGVGG